MKNNKSASHANRKSSSNKSNLKQGINLDDVVRMKFLEKSAQYLGVFVESRPADYLYLGEHSVN